MKQMGNLIKQAQKLQSQMLKLQEELAEKTVESAAGGGMVKRSRQRQTADRLHPDRQGGRRPRGC